MQIALMNCRSCRLKSFFSLAAHFRRINPLFHYDQYRHSSINTGINRGLRESRIALRRRDQKDKARNDRNEFKSRPSNTGRSRTDTKERRVTIEARDANQYDIGLQQSNKPRRFQNNTFESQDKLSAETIQHDEDSDSVYDEGVPFTTAASTFIFGSRPALAALRANRRKFYNLYILSRPKNDKYKYGDVIEAAKTRGLTRKLKSRAFLSKLKDAVQVSDDRNRVNGATLATQDQPAIDDGVCIEVSSLPKQPVVSLERFSHGSSTFSVQLDHQSREDAAVNGTSNEVEYAGGGWRAPCLLWLHGVVDAQNVGAILRSALYFGVDGVILSSRGTADISPGVLKASAGAAEYMPLFKVQDPKSFILHSRAKGWVFYATVAPSLGPREDHRSRRSGSQPLMLQSVAVTPVVNSPTIIVFGNEDEGLPFQLVRAMDERISIGGISKAAEEAHVDSLNISVACAMFCEKFLSKPRSNRPNEGRSTPFRLITHK